MTRGVDPVIPQLIDHLFLLIHRGEPALKEGLILKLFGHISPLAQAFLNGVKGEQAEHKNLPTRATDPVRPPAAND